MQKQQQSKPKITTQYQWINETMKQDPHMVQVPMQSWAPKKSGVAELLN